MTLLDTFILQKNMNFEILMSDSSFYEKWWILRETYVKIQARNGNVSFVQQIIAMGWNAWMIYG